MGSILAQNGQLFTLPYTQSLSADGKPLPYCYRVFYLTNSTTAATVYQDPGLQTPYTPSPGNVVTAGSSGQFAPIYLNPGFQYRCQLFDVNNRLLEDCDPVNPPAMGTPYVVGAVRSAVKATSTSRTNVFSLTADPDLAVKVPNAGTYKIDLDLVMTAGAAGATPGIELYLGIVGQYLNSSSILPVSGTINGAVATAGLPLNTFLSLSLGTTAISNTVRFSGTAQIKQVVLTNGTASLDQFVLFWCQQNASPTIATTILAGSSLTVTQVS